VADYDKDGDLHIEVSARGGDELAVDRRSRCHFGLGDIETVQQMTSGGRGATS